MATHRNYGVTEGFNELRHEHLQPSSVDTNELLATLAESLDEAMRICRRNISCESTSTEDETGSSETTPSFCINPNVLASSSIIRHDQSNFVRTPEQGAALRSATSPPSPTHPPFVAHISGEHFIPDFMNSHLCLPTLGLDARNRIADLFNNVDHALQELQSARQLLSSTVLRSTEMDTSAEPQVSGGRDVSSDVERPAQNSAGRLARWADLPPYDARQRSTDNETPPLHGECFAARDRDQVSFGIHCYVAL
jgi:hypothetical protein